MKWIQASIRLPEITGVYNMKFVSKISGTVARGVSVIADKKILGLVYFNGTRETNIDECLDEIYWLDETPDQPQPDETLEQAADSYIADNWASKSGIELQGHDDEKKRSKDDFLAGAKVGAAHIKTQMWSDEDMVVAFHSSEYNFDEWFTNYKNNKNK